MKLLRAVETAELEALESAAWSSMVVAPAFDKCKSWTENFTERRRIVTHDGKTAATFRPIRRESADNDVAARAHHLPHTLRIGCTVVRLGEEMKRGTVVP